MRGRAAVLGLAALGLALIAPAQAVAGGCGTVTEGSAPDGARAVVDLQSMCFGPSILRVVPGDTVTFVNRDPFRHSVLGAGFGWGRALLGPGRSFAVTFDRAGVYPYACYLHPGMTGAIVVGDGLGPGPATASGAVTAAGSSGGTAPTASAARPAGSSTPDRPVAGWLLVGLSGLLVGAAGSRLIRRRALVGGSAGAAQTNDA